MKFKLRSLKITFEFYPPYQPKKKNFWILPIMLFRPGLISYCCPNVNRNRDCGDLHCKREKVRIRRGNCIGKMIRWGGAMRKNYGSICTLSWWWPDDFSFQMPIISLLYFIFYDFYSSCPMCYSEVPYF